MGTSSAVYSRDAVRCLSSGSIVFRVDRRAYIPLVVYAGAGVKIPIIEHAMSNGNYYIWIEGFGNAGDICPDFFAAICEHLEYHKKRLGE